jgi:hypothetical protein
MSNQVELIKLLGFKGLHEASTRLNLQIYTYINMWFIKISHCPSLLLSTTKGLIISAKAPN